MNRNYYNEQNGYLESIQTGINRVRSFKGGLSTGIGTREEQLSRLKKEVDTADAIIIGAGAGLSTSAGLTYSGARFDKYFFDFKDRYGITDMYSGGFYPFEDEKIRWAWWARHIYFNRYIKAPKPVYEELLTLIRDKDYYVITTNVDHQFQKAGFDKKRLFYTQGDYGLFQSVDKSDNNTYDNAEWVCKAMEAQGFVLNDKNEYDLPADNVIRMYIPEEMIPETPDGKGVTTNLRADDSFVEDSGWHKASAAYSDFLRRHSNLHVLYLEIGVGSNTPVIIKYPFWAMTDKNPKAVYACMNYNEAFCPKQIEKQSICIDGDVYEALKQIGR